MNTSKVSVALKDKFVQIFNRTLQAELSAKLHYEELF